MKILIIVSCHNILSGEILEAYLVRGVVCHPTFSDLVQIKRHLFSSHVEGAVLD